MAKPQSHVDIWFDRAGYAGRVIQRSPQWKHRAVDGPSLSIREPVPYQPYVSLVEWESVVQKFDAENPLSRRQRKDEEVGGAAAAYFQKGFMRSPIEPEEGGALQVGFADDVVAIEPPPPPAAAVNEPIVERREQKGATEEADEQFAQRRLVEETLAAAGGASNRTRKRELRPAVQAEAAASTDHLAAAAFGDRTQACAAVATTVCSSLTEPFSSRRKAASARRKVVDRELSHYRARPASMSASRTIDRPLRRRLAEILEKPMLDPRHLHPSRQHPAVPVANLRLS
mmetsp:Transcript_42530/g.97474  ORF Transcript_42530/g.97474 Transcript_42530/m.97474 type:complete len:286 (+) Transcript_42530:46-903(+)